MDNGVNITAGLPYVRTSPDHGTAFDIAGCNKASEASFRQAIYTAIDIHRNRKADDEARKTHCRSSITSARKMATATDTSRLTLPLRAKRQCARMWRRRLNRLFDNYDL